MIETLVYLTIFAIFSVVVVQGVVVSMRSFTTARVHRLLAQSSVDVFERMTREIQSGASVDLNTSIFDINPGILAIQSLQNDVSTTKTFSVSSSTISLDQDGASLGNLLSDDVDVTNLVFRHGTTAASEFVKIEMTLETNLRDQTSADFYNTIILRGSY